MEYTGTVVMEGTPNDEYPHESAEFLQILLDWLEKSSN